MPKPVDHARRRAQIIDGLVRLAGRAGLHAVTMRAVAAEAGVSLRLVQYYFRDKSRLMHAALEELERRSHERWSARLEGLPSHPPARAYLDAFVAEALPDDEGSRTFQLLWTSYAVLAMTDPEMAALPFVAGPARLEQQLADVLARARVNGELAAERDPMREAARLLALNHGLGTSVLIGHRSAADAMAIARDHLDELFSPPSATLSPRSD